jgi:hypothetical protein
VAPTRVHDLARELGVDSAQVLAWFRELGVPVRSGSAVVPPEAQLRLRTAHAAGALPGPGEPEAARPSSPSVGSVHPRSTRSWSRVLAESRRVSTAWEDYWFTARERREWMAAGLGPDDGRIAGRLKDRGFVPDDLQLRVDGVRACERLRGGEPVSVVIARLRELKRAGRTDTG